MVDEHPRFHLDALRWFACLTVAAGVRPNDLVVHVVGRDEFDVLSHLQGQGVTVRPVERFDRRSPHCNKISGAVQLAKEGIDGMAVLCDTDLAVLDDPRRLDLPTNSIAAKPVDAPVPPLEVVLRIFEAAGLTPPPTVDLPWGPDDRTVVGNSNGGLYLVPGTLLPPLSTAWGHWARWLLDRSHLLHDWSVYVDQVAMALALQAEGIDTKALGARWNTPTHDPSRIPAGAEEPAIIHYHQEVDRTGLLLRTSNEAINRRIDTANAAIGGVWPRAQPARALQRWLDGLEEAEAISASTTRNRAIVTMLVDALGVSSVLEVGNLERGITTGLPIESYTGIDDPTGGDQSGGSGGLDGRVHPAPPNTPADLTVCLGSLHRQPDAGGYEDMVRLLCESTGQALLVSGWEDRAGMPEAERPYFYEALSETLQRVAPDLEIYPVDRVEPATVVALRPPPDRHPRDFTTTTLDPLMARHPDPLTLINIRLHARHTTGFYPDHAPRLWEYPVVGRLISDRLPAGSRLVDVGAGVTPLAPYLTSLGFVVDTVDPSPNRRDWASQPDWNEWDFLDYGAAGLAHRSWNCTLDGLPKGPAFDGAYSVSVIEHMGADRRRALLSDIAARVRSGGLVVLTIDLVRGTDNLWNRNLGVEVEDFASHGTIQDVIDECAAVGLELFHHEVVRDWGDVSVDIGLLALRRAESASSHRWRSAGRTLLSRVRRPPV